MKSLKNSLALCILFCSTFAFGQQLPQFTQYMYNTISINPAYAGSRETLSLTALHRNQWSGLEGNPTTSTLSIHSPIKMSNLGVGLSYINDNLGYEKTNYIYADVSYSLPISNTIDVAVGLKAGATNYSLRIPDTLDPYYADGFSEWNPNVGAGLFVSSNRWYVGLSVPRLLNTDLNSGQYKAREVNSYYAIAGYVFDVARNVKFKPTALMKFTNGAPASYDVTANFLFNEKLWVGAAYRFNQADSFGGYADYAITPNFRLGYAYDLPTSKIRPYSGGTHEVILIYELPKRIFGSLKSPRYF